MVTSRPKSKFQTVHHDAFNQLGWCPFCCFRQPDEIRQRSANTAQHQKPRCRTESGKRAFYNVPLNRNTLPPSLPSMKDPKLFIKHTQTSCGMIMVPVTRSTDCSQTHAGLLAQDINTVRAATSWAGDSSQSNRLCGPEP
jgi:hypothetical protein